MALIAPEYRVGFFGCPARPEIAWNTGNVSAARPVPHLAGEPRLLRGVRGIGQSAVPVSLRSSVTRTQHLRHPGPGAAEHSCKLGPAPDEPGVKHGLEDRSPVRLGLWCSWPVGNLGKEFAKQQGVPERPVAQPSAHAGRSRNVEGHVNQGARSSGFEGTRGASRSGIRTSRGSRGRSGRA